MDIGSGTNTMQDQDDSVEQLTNSHQDPIQALKERTEHIEDLNDWSDYHQIAKALKQLTLDGVSVSENDHMTAHDDLQAIENERLSNDLRELNDWLNDIRAILKREVPPYRIQALEQIYNGKPPCAATTLADSMSILLCVASATLFVYLLVKRMGSVREFNMIIFPRLLRLVVVCYVF